MHKRLRFVSENAVFAIRRENEMATNMSALADPAEARRWGGPIGLPPGHANSLVVNYIETLPDEMEPEQLAAWRVAQERNLTENPLMRLSNKKRAKVGNLLIAGRWLPYGQALAKSEFRHSAHLWHTIAKHGF
jgi:hypothetical protein